MARWLVDLKGKRVTRLGTVNAGSEREAIEEASRRFGIAPVNHCGLVSSPSTISIRSW
jgi:hypothetical protein